jgi:hypothetical protein
LDARFGRALANPLRDVAEQLILEDDMMALPLTISSIKEARQATSLDAILFVQAS